MSTLDAVEEGLNKLKSDLRRLYDRMEQLPDVSKLPNQSVGIVWTNQSHLLYNAEYLMYYIMAVALQLYHLKDDNAPCYRILTSGRMHDEEHQCVAIRMMMHTANGRVVVQYMQLKGEVTVQIFTGNHRTELSSLLGKVTGTQDFSEKIQALLVSAFNGVDVPHSNLKPLCTVLTNCTDRFCLKNCNDIYKSVTNEGIFVYGSREAIGKLDSRHGENTQANKKPAKKAKAPRDPKNVAGSLADFQRQGRVDAPVEELLDDQALRSEMDETDSGADKDKVAQDPPGWVAQLPFSEAHDTLKPIIDGIRKEFSKEEFSNFVFKVIEDLTYDNIKCIPSLAYYIMAAALRMYKNMYPKAKPCSVYAGMREQCSQNSYVHYDMLFDSDRGQVTVSHTQCNGQATTVVRTLAASDAEVIVLNVSFVDVTREFTSIENGVHQDKSPLNMVLDFFNEYNQEIWEPISNRHPELASFAGEDDDCMVVKG
jgi:hypothetical protein